MCVLPLGDCKEAVNAASFTPFGPANGDFVTVISYPRLKSGVSALRFV